MPKIRIRKGEVSIEPIDIDNGSTDACGIASYTASQTDFTCADLGTNLVVLTVTDVNGNMATCSAYVTVEDNLPPLVRTRNVMVFLDKNGKGSVTPAMIDNGSTDNCTIVSMWLEGLTQYGCGDVGEHEIVLKARDQSGNVGSWNAFVTVKNFKPVFENIHEASDGDTIHRVDCQVPWDISRYDLVNYEEISRHGTVKTFVYREELPEDAPWSMYALWRYEYIFEDACAHICKFNYYLALYDLNPPTYQDFPNDTTVAAFDDLPPVDEKVKIIDLCQYVEWDTVITTPIPDLAIGEVLGYTRRWKARDPSGHQSFRDQMIWIGTPGDRARYSMITGRIADEGHLMSAKFAGEAGTNGLPVSLYRLDIGAGSRTWVRSWITGDWMGAQGMYYFVPEDPGCYQVKIDTAICLVDTVTFNKYLWSDTLTVAAGESIDQGFIITHPCMDSLTTRLLAVSDYPSYQEVSMNEPMSRHGEWTLFPNPSTGYLHIDIQTDREVNYRLYDALGRLVKSGVYQQGQPMDVQGLNSGVYHLQLREEDKLLGMRRVLMISD